MATLDIQRKAIDAMTIMNVALTNIRLYPPTSAIIRNTIDRVYQILGEIFEAEGSVVFAESGPNFIVCGGIFSENDQKKFPQAMSFLELMVRFGVNSVAFQKRISKQELKTFLKIMSRGRREIEAAGGLQRVIENEKLPNIIIDHKVYVVVDKDQQIIASIDLSDEDVVRYVTGDLPLSEEDVEKLREMAKDPRWVAQVFQAGMAHIMRQRGEKSYDRLSEILLRMIRTLDEISEDINRDRISGELAHAIVDMDEETLTLILTEDTEGMFSEELFDQVIAKLDDRKFERLAGKFRRIGGSMPRANGVAAESASQTYRFMMRSEKGKRLAERIQRRMDQEKALKEQQVSRLKSALNSILKGDVAPLRDDETLSLMSGYLFQLFEVGKGKSAEIIIDRLTDRLFGPDHDIRERAAGVLAEVSDLLIAEHRLDPLVRALPRRIEWVTTESVPLSACSRMFGQLQHLARELIREYRFTESHPVLETFNRIYYGKIARSKEISRMAGDALRDIATGDVMDLLLEEFQINEINKRKQAIHTLSQLGEISMERLLELLQKSHDMSERVRVLRAVSEIGQPVPQTLIEKIGAGGPWYYMRNLILVLGKIGTEDHLPILIPLLRHEDFRVQRETLNSIYNIGGKYRGEILISALPDADERIRLNIVDMLGALKYENAVVPLLQIVESKSFFSSRDSDKLREKACIALGRIGSPKAVPPLRGIAEQKTILGIISHSDQVKAAAEKALRRIRSTAAHAGKPAGAVKIPVNRKLTLPDAGGKDAPEALPAGAEAPGAVTVPLFTLPEKPKVRQDGDTLEETTVSMLLASVEQYARNKQFDKAEAARQELVRMDDMALSEILRAEEIIEREKNETDDIEQDHLGIWPELYDMLTPEEANALYYATEEAVYESDELIFRQGEQSSRLCFIHKGQLKLFFTHGERESLLKVIGRSDVVGEDTFFSISVCTVSLSTLSHVELSYLDKSVLEQWKTDFPALESKLHDYCLGIERVRDIIRNKGLERRTRKRVDIRGAVSIRLLSSTGAATGKNFRGSFMDISEGGLSFMIKANSRKNVSLLLGRKLDMTFDFPRTCAGKLDLDARFTGNALRVRQIGTVIGVSHRQGDDYSVHIKFDRSLGEAITEQTRT
ncbi:hypothetical protein DENIS_4070 [Desulfonema ishimotonii]|uniref:Cyclic nucleotide-binding domain-containing protein n=1 Tax=Desulfonema ishimotonii TaxID=45657 RepID=A0A401G1J2_9BACT|nr:HEAT repeat domain-containing protein [Desulfonema ishimotonii]GBC63081.1 hypothetical protein DENIS_4070 [Desulfonema ishimotonii]